MKLITTFLVTFFLFFCQDLPTIRAQYVDAPKSQKNTEAFYNFMANYNSENEVLVAYKGAAIAMKARYAKQIKEKKMLFIQGIKFVESAVKKEPKNLEIRLIRISIQENSPKILNYKSNISEDKNLILNNFDKQNQSLKVYLKNYIIQSNLFTDKEKKSISN